MSRLQPESGKDGSDFSRTRRLLSPGDYRQVFQGKNIRVSNRLWTILAVTQPQDSQNPTPLDSERVESARLGLAIAKKRARRAVDRNRCKRVARESFRLNQRKLSGFDIVAMNRDDSARATTNELRSALEQLWDKLLQKSKAGSSSRNTKPAKTHNKHIS